MVRGNLLHYYYSEKDHLKCTARAKVRITDGVGNELEYACQNMKVFIILEISERNKSSL